MKTRRLGTYAFGWLSLLGGYALGLLLIRGIFLGVTQGFRADRSQALWIILAYLVFLVLGVHLFALGRRTLAMAKGSPYPPARFGWGRIVLGTVVLYSSAVDHFHLMPEGPIRRVAPANETEAAAMGVTAIVIATVCVALILSGLWRGLRHPPTGILQK